MKKGGFMGGDTIIIICLFAFALYGIYKYSMAENDSYKKFVEKANDFQGALNSFDKRLDSQDKKISELENKVNNFIHKFETLEARYIEIDEEMDNAQEHMARMRESQIQLKDRSYPRSFELKLTPPKGAIPIEIYSKTPVKKKKTVTRKSVTKTKTGYRSRSETRQSALKGNPDAPPKRKVRRKKAAPKKKTKTTRKKRKSSSLNMPGLRSSKKALKEAGV